MTTASLENQPPTAREQQRTCNAHALGPTTPLVGDILVSRRRARADVYAITVLPGFDRAVLRRYEEGINQAEALGRVNAVDAW